MPDVMLVRYPKKKRKTRKKSKITGEKLYTRNQWEDKYWDAFSKYIRTRDGWTCVMKGWRNHICSGKWIQAGHVIAKEDISALKFEERDVFAQCSGSNLNHKYRPSEYTSWFLEQYGQEAYNTLSQLKNKPYKHPTIEECKAGIAYYEKRTQQLHM